MWILDTDHLKVLEYAGSASAERLQRKLLALQPTDYATTIISYEEQCRGWLEKIKRKKLALEQVGTYRKLHRQLQHYCSWISTSIRLLNSNGSV